MTPTARTLARLRGDGWTCDIVERRISKKVTKDYCGFGDVFAFVEPCEVMGDTIGPEFLIVQATDITHVALRRKKIVAEPNARRWLQAGGRVEVWGWSKTKTDPRVVVVTLEDFQELKRC